MAIDLHAQLSDFLMGFVSRLIARTRQEMFLRA